MRVRRVRVPSGLAIGLMLMTAGAVATAWPAAADPAIARRLAALNALVRRTPPTPPTPAGAGRCAANAWWRSSPYALRDRIDSAVRDASLRYAVDVRLIRSVIRQESAGNIDAVSYAGAMGLMQLMPGTARDLGVRCAFDPRENVLGGTRYLRAMRDRLGSWPRAVAAYHAGPRNIERGIVPRETRRYVTRVLRGWKPDRYAGPIQLP